MKILIVDPVGGISGDMLLAGLIHLGCPRTHLEQVFGMLDIGPFTLNVVKDSVSGISCIHLRFDIPKADEPRTYSSIRNEILGRLPDEIRQKAQKIFHALAEAEAEVHGCALEDVHFHEIGALDSILDIVGISAALDWLGVEAVYSYPVPLGKGLTDSLHGKIPMPAPATVRLLEGLKVRLTAMEAELTTPTGAAFLRAFAEKGDLPSDVIIRSSGYGCGSRRFDHWPNLVRVMLCEKDAGRGDIRTYQIEADIDDMMPEDCTAALERIMDAGALDAGITPRIMKQGRPGVTISALCEDAHLPDVIGAFLVHTTTIGVRYYEVERMVLPRRQYRLATRYGEVGIKEVALPDGTLRCKPEYKDLHEISRAAGISMTVLRDEVERMMREDKKDT